MAEYIKKKVKKTKECSKWLKPYQWKKGQSGNPSGKPKGKSLKKRVEEYFLTMTDEEAVEFLNRLPPELVWKMGEGNPPQTTTLEGEVKIPIPILKLNKKDKDEICRNNSDKKDNCSE
jgi:hypothetical protein